jgi:hypothetical protein
MCYRSFGAVRFRSNQSFRARTQMSEVGDVNSFSLERQIKIQILRERPERKSDRSSLACWQVA